MGMTTTEAKLQERVKELTCLYEVTSIIVNSDYDQLETSLEAIVHCLQRAWQFEKAAEALVAVGNYQLHTTDYKPEKVSLVSDIKVFNKVEGKVIVSYPSEKYTLSDFLKEEKTLLDNVSLAIGSLLERKHIRDSEAAARRQMERTDRLHILGEITAGIAHELNTPLANILGFTELLKENVRNEENIRDLEKIIENTIFSREIVKKLMFFACEMPQEMNVVHLNQVIENVLKLLKPSLTDKKIKIATTYSNENIKMKADTVQFTQVFFNLIMNAVYYSPMQGKIIIDVRENTRRIEINVMDKGEGIALEHEDKIFEPFFTTKPIGEGSGLGLSVVHGIIDSHKGTITYRPNTPKGAIFTIDFPKL